jgi:hypothetical protein
VEGSYNIGGMTLREYWDPNLLLSLLLPSYHEIINFALPYGPHQDDLPRHRPKAME